MLVVRVMATAAGSWVMLSLVWHNWRKKAFMRPRKALLGQQHCCLRCNGGKRITAQLSSARLMDCLSRYLLILKTDDSWEIGKSCSVRQVK